MIMLVIPCNAAHQGKAIINMSGQPMPMGRTQIEMVGGHEKKVYTSFAKKGYTFAVKNNIIVYMSVERAKELGAKMYSTSYTARKSIKKAK